MSYERWQNELSIAENAPYGNTNALHEKEKDGPKGYSSMSREKKDSERRQKRKTRL